MTLDMNARLTRLEQAISEIQRKLEIDPLVPATAPREAVKAKTRMLAKSAVITPAQNQTLPIPQSPKSPLIPARFKSVEFLLSLLGIGLLLIGVAFLFKYAIDQGWITPELRLATGYSIGAILLLFGLRLQNKRRTFSQVLNGGAIGAFYTTTFAGYFIFELIPFPIALGLMSTTTILAFGLAVWRREQVLAHIGLIGGLLTPFVLPTDSGNVADLFTYTAFVITAATAIYFALKWRPVLLVATVGGWLIYFVSFLDASNGFSKFPLDANQWAFQLMAIFFLLAFSLLPMTRYVMETKQGVGQAGTSWFAAPWTMLLSAVFTPLLVMFLSTLIWDLEKNVWGIGLLAITAVYALAAWWLDKEKTKPLAHALYLVAATFLAWAITLLLDGDVRFIALTVEAVGLMYIAKRWGYPVLEAVAHIIYLALIPLFVITIFDNDADPAFATLSFLSAAIYLLAGVGMSNFTAYDLFKIPYRLGAHIGAMALIMHEAWHFDTPDIAFSLWFILAWAVFICGAFIQNKLVRYQAIAAMLATTLAMFAADSSSSLNWHHLLFVFSALQLFVLSEWGEASRDRWVKIGAYVLTFLLVGWQIGRFNYHATEPAFLNWTSLTTLLFIAVLVYVSNTTMSKLAKNIYGLIAHFFVLAWIAFQAQSLPNPQVFISALWAAYAIGLLVWGLTKDKLDLRQLGLATILLVVGKLFLVDLVEVETIFRILLFIGFGAMLLIVSYFFQSLWRKTAV